MNKLEDSNELPVGWAWTTIGNVAEVNPSRPRYEGFSDDEPATFIPMAAVSDDSGIVVSPEERSLGSIRRKSYRTFTSGDVLFAKITPCMENGKSAIVPPLPNGLGFGSTEFHVLRPSRFVLPEYLWRFMRQESYRHAAQANMTGSVGQMRVPADYVRVTPLPLPPTIDEQRAIIDLVEAMDKRRASASARLQVAERAVRRFRQAVLAAACSGRLTAEWREEHPSTGADVVEAVRRARAGLPKAVPPEEVAPPNGEQTPDNWTWVSFGSVIGELRNGVSPAPAMEPPGIEILRISAVRSSNVDLGDVRFLRDDPEKWKAFALKDRDLLFTRYNGSISLLGVCGTVRGLGLQTILYPDKLMRVRFDHDAILPEYIEIFFSSPGARERMTEGSVSSAGQQGISGLTVKAQPLALPSLQEQGEIVRRVDELLALAQRLQRRIEAATRRVDRSSQAVLAKAFRGELIPTVADQPTPKIGDALGSEGKRAR